MNEIVRWTTPTFKIKFETIDPADIVTAYLTIQKNGTTVLQIDDTNMATGEDYISWTLTQTQCSALTVGTQVIVLCDWVLEDGTRGRSKTACFRVTPAGVDEVI